MDKLRNFHQFGRKIIGVGRNYQDRAAEQGLKSLPTKPLLFVKPPSSYIIQGQKIKIPEGCNNLEQGVEFGVVIGKKGFKIDKSKAMDYVGGYALALDMTAKDFLNEAKQKGQPWLIPKGFDSGCPVSDFVEKSKIPDPHQLEIWCSVNGKLKQKTNTSLMIFDIPTVLAFTSKFVTLDPGDFFILGSPTGSGRVLSGDKIKCGITNVLEMEFEVE